MEKTVERCLHFSVEGEFITKAAREKLFVDKDLAAALRILRSSTISDDLDSDTQLMLCLHILHGSASIVGNTADGSYGIETRDDLKERPTELSSIAKLIMDMAAEIKSLKEENYDMAHKISSLAEEMDEYTLYRINEKWRVEEGVYMFPDMAAPKNDPMFNKMLDSYLRQRRREKEMMENNEEPECDYGWLEPDGTWHPVEWGKHAKWADDWLKEHKPIEKYPKLYSYKDEEDHVHSLGGNDVLVYSLNWVLLDSPYQGEAKITNNPNREMTKAQKEFLYDYFIARHRHEEANALYAD